MKTINVQCESRTARDCFRTANNCLGLAERSDEQWEIDHHCVTGVVFAAFAVEAMINHFGQIYFADWNDQKGQRKHLHKKVFKKVNLPCYLGSTKYQQVDLCFDIRDSIVHGKTRNHEFAVDISEEAGHENIVTKIVSNPAPSFSQCNTEMLESFINLASEIQRDIEDNGFYPDTSRPLAECPLTNSGLHTWSNNNNSIGRGLPIAEEPSLITVRTDRVYGDPAVADGDLSKSD
jgi:hypothetical protein